MLTKEHIAERRNYIGGSDCAAVLGLSRWMTPLEVWAIKTGQIEPEDISGKLAVKLGDRLEQTVAELFMEETGKKVQRVNEVQVHPNYSFIRAQIDRRVVGEDEILECKTASAWKAKEWAGEEMPQEYILQCMHQLAVTGKSRCYLAVLIGGNVDFKYKVIDRDPMIIAEILNKESEFWHRYVEPKVMPSVITKNDGGVLFKLFPNGDDGEPMPLDDKADAILESLQALKADAVNLDEQIEKAENEIKAILKDKTYGVSERFKVSWKEQERWSLDVAAIKKEQPKIAEKYSKGSKSRIFRVNAITKQTVKA